MIKKKKRFKKMMGKTGTMKERSSEKIQRRKNRKERGRRKEILRNRGRFLGIEVRREET